MKILIFGGKGGLGSKVTEHLKNHEVVSLNSKDCNIVNGEDVKNVIMEHQPDVIINMAVLNIDGFLHKQSEETLKVLTNVNILGLLNISKYSMEFFRIKGSGKFIAFSSILALDPIKGTSVYSASKAFADNLVQTLAVENAKYNISCNTIQLGYFDGGLTDKIKPEFLKQVVDNIPLQRLGTAQELATLLEYIMSSSYLTGANIKLAGGL